MRGGDAAPARLMAALAQVELDGVADERARAFSAGMKRRLALARVLLGQARVLLLDEPFSGLDQRGRKWVHEFLQTFKAGGGAAVVATHSGLLLLLLAVRLLVRLLAVPIESCEVPAPPLRSSGYFTNTHAGCSRGNATNPTMAVAATSTGLLIFHRNSTIKLARATSAVSQSPIAIRPRSTEAPRMVPIAAA